MAAHYGVGIMAYGHWPAACWADDACPGQPMPPQSFWAVAALPEYYPHLFGDRWWR